ncbi:MAG: exosortase/archaeosortase family protein [Abditibacteriota bacterium]|nr:exosortase/archaeosortase family protein [Abditibacteriota bacterium]
MTQEQNTATAQKTPKKISLEMILLAVLVVAACVMYAHTFVYLWGKWDEESQYSLGFLVPPICAYFAWVNREKAAQAERKPSIWGLVLIVIALIFHIAGTVLDVSGPSALSIVIFITGCCLYLWGPELVKVMSFPLAYMLFMIPIPGGLIDRIGLPLQIFASKASEFLLRMMAPNVTRTGIQLAVDGHDFQVAQACSGLSSLIALLCVGAVFAYMTRLKTSYKWILFACSLPIAVAANVIRITSIALVGHYWSWDKAMGFYHDWGPFPLFFLAIVMLFIINGVLEWISSRRDTSA